MSSDVQLGPKVGPHPPGGDNEQELETSNGHCEKREQFIYKII